MTAHISKIVGISLTALIMGLAVVDTSYAGDGKSCGGEKSAAYERVID